MGKYSLDAFERYPLTKLRPAVAAWTAGGCRILALSWSRLEPDGGAHLQPPEIGAGPVLLRLHLDQQRDLPDACGFVRRMGECYHGGEALAGVILTCGDYSGAERIQLVQTYARSFEKTFLLAEPGTELMALCRKAELRPGLLLPLEKGILPLRRSIARESLERTWRTRPVYLEAGRALTPEELDAAGRWHVSGADTPAPLGPQMTLRRMMFPRDLTSGGVLPLRMWWQNLGTAPVYREVRVLLALGEGTERAWIPVCQPMTPGLGDTTLNVTAQLPRLPGGTYDLWVGLQAGNARLILTMDAPAAEGLYRIGQITLDEVERPYLSQLWQTQYADGYYPLEDPAQPE